MLAIRRTRVIVNLVNGKAISGERRWSWPWTVRLLAAEIHEDTRLQLVPVRVDGAVLIPRHRIDFIQVLP